MIKVLIADDHPIFLFGLKNMLSKYPEIEVVGTAKNGREALEMAVTQAPDVILLDVIMPEVDGITVASQLKESHPEIAILFLSGDTSEATIARMVEVRCDGFVPKYAQESELVKAISTVADGVEYFAADFARLIERVHLAKQASDDLFTQRELDVIKLSCQGLQYKEIADRLGVSFKTVDNVKSSIFHKLGINNSVELVLYAIKRGIITL